MHTTSGQAGYVQHACANAEAYLAAEVVGQDLAIRQLTDAVGLAYNCVCGASVHYGTA